MKVMSFKSADASTVIRALCRPRGTENFDKHVPGPFLQMNVCLLLQLLRLDQPDNVSVVANVNRWDPGLFSRFI